MKLNKLKEITVPDTDNIIFFSDAHLGNQPYRFEKEREEVLISFIQEISKKTKHIFILGDLFDFWFEYNSSIYKRYIRILSELMNFTDNNIKVHYLVGNHDFWMKNLFKDFFKFKIYYDPVILNYHSKKIFIAHGDGLNPKDKGYLLIKKLFRSPFTIRLYSWLHPDLAWNIAHLFSKTSRKYTEQFSDVEIKELKKFANNLMEGNNLEGVILGHTHAPEEINSKHGFYINSGDWIKHFSYIEAENGNFKLKYYKK